MKPKSRKILDSKSKIFNILFWNYPIWYWIEWLYDFFISGLLDFWYQYFYKPDNRELQMKTTFMFISFLVSIFLIGLVLAVCISYFIYASKNKNIKSFPKGISKLIDGLKPNRIAISAQWTNFIVWRILLAFIIVLYNYISVLA